jgi:BA14K-like protein
MRKILIAGTAALFTALAVAGSTAPANAFGLSFGYGGSDWGDDEDSGFVVELPIYSSDATDDEDDDAQHVAWCEGRYKTYDEDSDTYAYAPGKRKTCVAPFD